jgi:hypothetical protein
MKGHHRANTAFAHVSLFRGVSIDPFLGKSYYINRMCSRMGDGVLYPQHRMQYLAFQFSFT